MYDKVRYTLAASLLLLITSVCAQEIVEIEIKDFKYIPAEVTIKQGDTVRWINLEKRQYHSIWFEANGEKESDYFFPEESFDKNFPEKGDFTYRCGPHPEMKGVIHVR